MQNETIRFLFQKEKNTREKSYKVIIKHILWMILLNVAVLFHSRWARSLQLTFMKFLKLSTYKSHHIFHAFVAQLSSKYVVASRPQHDYIGVMIATRTTTLCWQTIMTNYLEARRVLSLFVRHAFKIGALYTVWRSRQGLKLGFGDKVWLQQKIYICIVKNKYIKTRTSVTKDVKRSPTVLYLLETNSLNMSYTW